MCISSNKASGLERCLGPLYHYCCIILLLLWLLLFDVGIHPLFTKKRVPRARTFFFCPPNQIVRMHVSSHDVRP